MKRILAFVVVLSVLLSVCSISAAAAPLYSVEADAEAVTPFALTALNAAVTADTGSTLINGDSSYWSAWGSLLGNYFSSYFEYAGYQIDEAVYRCMQSLNSSLTYLSEIELTSDFIKTDVASILNDMGAITSAIQTVITAIETNTAAVNGVNTSVSQVNTSVGTLNTNLLNMFTVSDGWYILNGSGVVVEASGMSFSALITSGFTGLRALISGSEFYNTYPLTLWDNNNTSTSTSAFGLGPMLNSHLASVGENLAKLTFMFAADDDIQLKADSQPVLDEVTDTVFGAGSGKVKLDVSNVSDLTGMSDDVLGYFETGGQLGDINTVVNDDSTWLWFTAQTAADLDTTGSSLSLAYDETNCCIDSRSEWYSLFYRDVLGRDYVGG